VLRTICYRTATSLARNNAEFAARLDYLMNRRENPLARRQAYIALANKMLRTLHVMWTTGKPYEPAIATGAKKPNPS
jgi:hypothetical protein